MDHLQQSHQRRPVPPQMSNLPFENNYKLRKVAETDSRACSVCYKPTSAVLVSDNQKDFFYVCLTHLKDTGFSNPIYSDEREEVTRKLKEKQDKVKIINFMINEKSKSGTWNKIFSLAGSNGATKNQEKEKDKDNGNDTSKAKTSEANETKAKAEGLKKTVEDLQSELRNVNREVDELSKKKLSLEQNVKQYRLHHDIYRIRLSNHHKKLSSQKRAEQITSGLIFPSVPNNLP